jgi:hypothetical protein
MRYVGGFALVTVSLLGGIRVPSVRACSLAGTQSFHVDPARQGTDVQAPVLTGLSVETVKRGKEADSTGCGQSASSCDDLGWIWLRAPATDDMTPAEQIGGQLSVVEGKVPAGMDVPSEPVMLAGTTGLTLWWTDGADDGQEAFDFTLEVVAIDLAGNRSAPMRVRVADGGRGCSWLPRGGGSGSALALVPTALGLALALRRRRGPSGGPPDGRRD